MNALARHYVRQGDARGEHSHPLLWLGTFFFNHPKRIGSTVVSDDDTRVSHGPLPALSGELRLRDGGLSREAGLRSRSRTRHFVAPRPVDQTVASCPDGWSHTR